MSAGARRSGIARYLKTKMGIRKKLEYLAVTYESQGSWKDPKVVGAYPKNLARKKVLLVDDAAGTVATILLALRILKTESAAEHVTVALGIVRAPAEEILNRQEIEIQIGAKTQSHKVHYCRSLCYNSRQQCKTKWHRPYP